MPRIGFFYGIVITMIGASVSILSPTSTPPTVGREASIAVDGAILGGSLPPRALRLVRDWAQCSIAVIACSSTGI